MRRTLVATALGALVLSGCAKHPTGAPRGWPGRAEWIVNGRTGERADFATMIDDIANADVVFVGEDHDNPHHHDLQRRILAALAERHANLGLGMEMLQERSQPVADDFTHGKIDSDGLARAVDWPRSWGFSFSMYRPILEVARARKLPLFALNADDDLVHRISKVGVDGLTAEEKARLPELDLGNQEYRAFVKEAFEGHRISEDGFNRFFAAQVCWDETMAARTADALHARPMMVIAGIGHLVRRMGIPSRVERRIPSAKTRVVLPRAANRSSRLDFKRSIDDHDADWIVITPEPDTELSAR